MIIELNNGQFRKEDRIINTEEEGQIFCTQIIINDVYGDNKFKVIGLKGDNQR